MKDRAVITGLGAISGLGLDVPSFWSALSAGRTAIRPFDLPIDDVRISVAAPVTGFDPESHFSEQELRLLDRFSQYAIVAAREAVADAGLTPGEKCLARGAVILGSACCGKQTDDEVTYRLYRQQRSRVQPFAILKGMASAPASMVSMDLGIRGPAFLIASACSSGAHAFIQGMSMVESGMVDIAVVGGTDAPFTYSLIKSWEALRVMSDDTCRPFCKDRSGMVLGEGAGVLVLESEQHAARRGAHVYAVAVGCAMGSDAGHISRPDVRGITSAMQAALDHAGIGPGEVDYINAHGTATQVNDAVETEAIHQVFGDQVKNLSVSSTKSMHGHALGASSALEVVATALALQHGLIPPTVNFTEPDDQCDLDYVPNQARTKELNVAMSNSFAFGGLNAVIVLKRSSQ